jgi:outer membrane protein assembly factor BamB
MKRMGVAVLSLCACFVSVAWGQQPAGKCLNNWSEFHRANMQRWNPCEKLLNVKNVGNLSVKWAYAAGNEVDSSPVVANGVVYVGSDLGDNKVYALNATTGVLLWSYTTTNSVASAPAVSKGVVYVNGAEVYALNAKTGTLLWSYATGGGSDSPSPAITEGVVYIGANNTVYALNANTGAKLWSYPTGGSVFSSPAVANAVVYVGSDDGKV